MDQEAGMDANIGRYPVVNTRSTSQIVSRSFKQLMKLLPPTLTQVEIKV